MVISTHELLHAIVTERALTASDGDICGYNLTTTVATDVLSDDASATNDGNGIP
jgi:hypothetical protein